MYIGIDLGTSGVKAILLSEQGDVLATHTEKVAGFTSVSALVGTRSGAVVAGDGPCDESLRRAAQPARREGTGHCRANAWRNVAG